MTDQVEQGSYLNGQVEPNMNNPEGAVRHSRIIANFGLTPESTLVLSGPRMYGLEKQDSGYDYISFAKIANRELYNKVASRPGQGVMESASYTQGVVKYSKKQELFIYSYVLGNSKIKVIVYTNPEQADTHCSFDKDLRELVKQHEISRMLCHQFLCHYEICTGAKEGESDLEESHIFLLLLSSKSNKNLSLEKAFLRSINSFLVNGKLSIEGLRDIANAYSCCLLDKKKYKNERGFKFPEDNLVLFKEGLYTEDICNVDFDIVRNLTEKEKNTGLELESFNSPKRERVSNYKCLGHNFYDINIPEHMGTMKACLMVYRGEIVSHGIGSNLDWSHYTAVSNKAMCSGKQIFRTSFNVRATASYLRRMIYTNLSLLDCYCLIVLFGGLTINFEEKIIQRPSRTHLHKMSCLQIEPMHDAYRSIGNSLLATMLDRI